MTLSILNNAYTSTIEQYAHDASPNSPPIIPELCFILSQACYVQIFPHVWQLLVGNGPSQLSQIVCGWGHVHVHVKAGHPSVLCSVFVGACACTVHVHVHVNVHMHVHVHVHVYGVMGFTFLLPLFSWCGVHVISCTRTCMPLLCSPVQLVCCMCMYISIVTG